MLNMSELNSAHELFRQKGVSDTVKIQNSHKTLKRLQPPITTTEFLLLSFSLYFVSIVLITFLC